MVTLSDTIQDLLMLGSLNVPLIPVHRLSVGPVMWIGARRHLACAAISVPDDLLIRPQLIPLTQAHDAA